jgi:hypothetical protein
MTRLWGNHERIAYGQVGFEAAWKRREAEQISRDLEKVAILGYD